MKRLMRQCRGHVWRRLQRPGCPVRPGSLFHYARLIVAAVITVAALAAPAVAVAQEARGTILGTVRDATGGVIPGATVTITNVAMGTTVTVVTNDVRLLPGAVPDPRHLPGHRRAPGLQEGGRAKSSCASPTGSTSTSRSTAGAATETVNVTADTPLLETTNASLGNVVDSRRDHDAADAARRSVRPHRPGGGRHLHRLRPARPAVRTDAHRRLLDGRHARQPQRPDDRRRAEHGDGERGRGHRLLRAAEPTSSRSSRSRPRRSTPRRATPRAASPTS